MEFSLRKCHILKKKKKALSRVVEAFSIFAFAFLSSRTYFNARSHPYRHPARAPARSNGCERELLSGQRARVRVPTHAHARVCICVYRRVTLHFTRPHLWWSCERIGFYDCPHGCPGCRLSERERNRKRSRPPKGHRARCGSGGRMTRVHRRKEMPDNERE